MSKSQQQLEALRARIADLQVKEAELLARIENEVDEDAVQAGVIVDFVHGKGANKQTLTGQVLGRKNAEPGQRGGDLVKVATGEGFDAMVLVINPGDVLKIHQGQ